MKSRIKELRGVFNLTQADLAKTVDVRRETIVHLEKGRYNPSLKLAYLLSKILQTTIDDLFIFEDSDFNQDQWKMINKLTDEF